MQKLDALVGPHSLERYAPLFLVMQSLLFVIGCFFWVDAVKDSVAFSPETWGRMAYSLPAEFWASLCMGASMISLIGLINPIHRWMVIVGGSLQILQNTALSYSAFATGGDLAVGLYASIFFTTVHMLMTAGAISEWRH